MQVIHQCLMVLSVVASCLGDTFTSILEMERLFDLEQNLVRALDDYLRHADFELQLMERHYNELQEVESEIGDVDSYAENPVNAYSVIKRQINSWPSTFRLMANSPYFETPKQLPEARVLTQMIHSIVKWQEETKTPTSEVARGWVIGIRPHANLTANDCFDIGVFCYNKDKMDLAVEWLEEAMLKVTKHKDQSASLVDIVERLFLAKCRAGDLDGSSSAYRSLITKKTSKWYSPSKELKKDYKGKTVTNCIAAALAAKKAKKTKVPSYFKGYDFSNELCCPNRRRAEGLSCYLQHFYDPYLVLGPVKVEVVNLWPQVTLIHDAITHDEILDVKEAALIKVGKPLCQGVKSCMLQLKSLTLGENGPVDMPNTRVAKILNKRMSILANLNLELFSEVPEVSVFGPGSGFTTKTDFTPEHGKPAAAGKIIYFLNDVAAGGLSAFPSHHLAVMPVKGAALVWLAGDEPLERGECPVTIGAKWVMEQTLRKKPDVEK